MRLESKLDIVATAEGLLLKDLACVVVLCGDGKVRPQRHESKGYVCTLVKFVAHEGEQLAIVRLLDADRAAHARAFVASSKAGTPNVDVEVADEPTFVIKAIRKSTPEERERILKTLAELGHSSVVIPVDVETYDEVTRETPTEPGWYRTRLHALSTEWGVAEIVDKEGVPMVIAQGRMFGPDLSDWEWCGRVSMPVDKGVVQRKDGESDAEVRQRIIDGFEIVTDYPVNVTVEALGSDENYVTLTEDATIEGDAFMRKDGRVVPADGSPPINMNGYRLHIKGTFTMGPQAMAQEVSDDRRPIAPGAFDPTQKSAARALRAKSYPAAIALVRSMEPCETKSKLNAFLTKRRCDDCKGGGRYEGAREAGDCERCGGSGWEPS